MKKLIQSLISLYAFNSEFGFITAENDYIKQQISSYHNFGYCDEGFEKPIIYI